MRVPGRKAGEKESFMDLIRQIEKEWNVNQLVKKGDHIIAGISGGADSVCLLAVLCALKERWELTVTAVHVNHSIRGETAIRDAVFVERLCREKGVVCHVETADVPAIARKKRLSLEEAGRIARYETFERIRRQCRADKIAVAHHMDDNAETILFQLVRGSGLRGMGGIEPRRGAVIRPLLSLTRKQIEMWLDQQGMTYMTDETNLSQDYARNKIRLTVLPYLENQISGRAGEHIVTCGKLCLEADDYLTGEAKLWLEKYGGGEREKIVEIPEREFFPLHPALKKYIIREAIRHTAGGRKDIAHIHIEEILRLFGLPVGKRLNLPDGIGAWKTYGGVAVGKDRAEMGGPETRIGACHMILTDFPYKKNEKIPENTYTKWFDYDTIKHAVSLRGRKSGDRISVARGQSKKLGDYMIDAKIPKEWRDEIPLVADGDQILWAVGYRMGEDYKVTEHTKRILQIVIEREEKPEGWETGGKKGEENTWRPDGGNQ